MPKTQANGVRPRAIAATKTAPGAELIRFNRMGTFKKERGGVDPAEEPNGIIRGLSVITRGEALGHRLWIDDVFLDQVAEFGRAMGRAKARFTHPDMSADGLAKHLGRVDNFERDGDQVFGDLRFFEAASISPEGDLAGYLMKLADEAPEDFGTSIVFWRDLGEELRFEAEHTDEDGTFTSPDPDNADNYRHARLLELEAVDVVGDPAANPGGLFSRTSAFVAQADAVARYAFGLTEQQPEHALFDTVHPERVRRFVQGFAARHNLTITQREPDVGSGLDRKESDMEWAEVTLESLTANRSDLAEQLKTQGRQDAAAEHEQALGEAKGAGAQGERDRFKALKEAFGDDEGDMGFVVEQFEKGASLDQAADAHRDHEIAQLKKRNAELEQELKSSHGAGPVGHSAPEEGAMTPNAHLRKAKEYQKEHDCTLEAALRATSAQRN